MRNKLTKTAIYSRANDPEALYRQAAELHEYAQKRNTRIVATYIEQSTAKKRYPAFRMMVKDILDGHVNAVLIYDMDRLPRNFSERAILLKLIDKKGVHLEIPSPIRPFTADEELELEKLLASKPIGNRITKETREKTI